MSSKIAEAAVVIAKTFTVKEADAVTKEPLFWEWFCVTENIALLISIAGLAFSIWNFWVRHRENKEKFDIAIIDYLDFDGITQFLVCISNHSAVPLTITGVEFCSIRCELEPTAVRGNAADWNFVHTPVFPLCVPGRGAANAYLQFEVYDSPHTALSAQTKVTFQIQTTRNCVQKTLLLGEISHYLHTRG